MLKYLALFFLSYELAKMVMPRLEVAWRGYNQARRKQLEKVMSTSIHSDNMTEIEINLTQMEEIPKPVGLPFYNVANLTYSIFLLMMIFQFEVSYTVPAIMIKILGRFVNKQEVTPMVVRLDGLCSALILGAHLYLAYM